MLKCVREMMLQRKSLCYYAFYLGLLCEYVLFFLVWCLEVCTKLKQIQIYVYCSIKFGSIQILDPYN